MKRLRFLGGVLLGLSLSVFAVASALAQEETVTVQIDPVGGSGVSGTAILVDVDAGTEVSLFVTGFEPNSSHATHIHVGQCPTPGAIVFDLPVLTADANGVATATGVVDTSVTFLRDGNHVVQTHVAGPPSFGAGIACGNIPLDAGAVAPEPAEPTDVLGAEPEAVPEEPTAVLGEEPAPVPEEPAVLGEEPAPVPEEPVDVEAVEPAPAAEEPGEVAGAEPAPVPAAPAAAGGPAALAAAAVVGMLGLFALGGGALLRRR